MKLYIYINVQNINGVYNNKNEVNLWNLYGARVVNS